MTEEDVDLDSSLRESLDSARAALEPSRHARAELFDRMTVALAAPPLPGPELTASAPGPGALVPAAWGKILAASVIVTAVAGTALLAPWSSSEPTGPSSRGIAPPVDESKTVAPPIEVPAVTPGPDPVAPDAPPSVAPPSPRSADSRRVEPVVDDAPSPLGLEEELARLRQAQAALRDGDAARALELMDGLNTARTSGALSTERGVTRVLALCALGRTGEAEEMARAVVQGSGGQVYRQRLAASCAKGAIASEPGDDSPALPTQSIESNGKGR